MEFELTKVCSRFSLYNGVLVPSPCRNVPPQSANIYKVSFNLVRVCEIGTRLKQTALSYNLDDLFAVNCDNLQI